jgi:TonB-dependent receptor
MNQGKFKSWLLSGAAILGGLAVQQMLCAPAALAQDATPATAPAPPAAQSTTMGEIIVVTNRNQAAAAQIKAMSTINVLSAEDLSHTAVHNVAEALALLPGISTTNTGTGFIGGVDAATRGEAMYAQVRGLDTAYSINLMNGVNIAEANPYTRSVQLNLLPPSGLQTIVVNLTGTPDQEGDFISGMIDYHTPSAFDFGPTHFDMILGGKIESQEFAYGQHQLGENFAIDGSKRFGSNDQFGIYLGVYYDTRNNVTSKIGGLNEASNDHPWGYAIQSGVDSTGAPTAANNSAPGLNPVNNLELGGLNTSLAIVQTQRYGANLSLDWRPDDTTSFFFRMNSARADTTDTVINSQIIGHGSLGSQNGLGTGDQGAPLGNGTYQLLIPDVKMSYWYLTNPQVDTLGNAQFGGDKTFGRLSVSGSVFFSTGKDNMPDQIQIAAHNNDNGGNGTTYGGTTLFNYNGKGYPIPLLSPYQFGILNNPGAFTDVQAPELTRYYSQEQLAGTKLDVKYDFDGGFLRFVKAGVKLLDAWHQSSSVDYQIAGATNGGNLFSSDYPTLASTGLFTNTFKNAVPGLYYQNVPNISQSKLFSLYYNLAANPAYGVVADDCGGSGTNTTTNAYLCNTTKTREEYAAAYTMADLKFGDLEIIPGIRYEHTTIHNTFFNIPPSDSDGNAVQGGFESNQGTEGIWLPSIFFNYRPSARSVYRFGVWDSYVRPPFIDLSGGSTESVSTNANGQTVTTIKQGNPNLKPVTATNVDLSGEWDSGAGGHVMVQVYYKAMRDYIYDSGNSPGNYISVGSNQLTYQIPANGGDASDEGFDIEVRQKFQGLPKPFDGLGVWGNFTRQYSGVNLGASISAKGFKDEIADAPGVLANAGIFYQKAPLYIDLNYNYEGDFIQTYDWAGLGNSSDDIWNSPVGRLDMHVGYDITHNIKLDLAVSNLTNAITYQAHVGKTTNAIEDTVLSGVSGAFNLTYRY